MAQVEPTLSYDALRKTDIVIEAVFEDIDIKHQVVKETEEVSLSYVLVRQQFEDIKCLMTLLLGNFTLNLRNLAFCKCQNHHVSKMNFIFRLFQNTVSLHQTLLLFLLVILQKSASVQTRLV